MVKLRISQQSTSFHLAEYIFSVMLNQDYTYRAKLLSLSFLNVDHSFIFHVIHRVEEASREETNIHRELKLITGTQWLKIHGESLKKNTKTEFNKNEWLLNCSPLYTNIF